MLSTLLLLAPAVLRAQESQPPTTQPVTTQPAVPDHLRTPRATVAHFLDAVDAGNLEAAGTALDFSALDPEVAREAAGQYVRQLADVLSTLRAAGLLDLDALPDDPAAAAQSIGRDPVVLVLERQEDRRWQFSATTVAAIPTLHERRHELAHPTASAPVTVAAELETEQVAADRLRSPYQMIEFFLVTATDARNKNPALYEQALQALDLSEADIEDVKAQGPEYVDGLLAILNWLRDHELFDREQLPRETEQESVAVGESPFDLVLVRQADGRWRFSAASVARVPEMMRSLRQQREQQPAAEAADVAPILREDTTSPQATMNLFLSAMNNGDLSLAVTCLELTRLSEAEKSVAGTLAGKVWLVLNRTKNIVITDIPRDPEHPEPYTVLNTTAGRIEIDRVRSGPRAGEWLFTAGTVASIDQLYEQFEREPLLAEFRDTRFSFWMLPGLYVREYVVPDRLKLDAAGLQAWQWIGIAAILIAGLILRWLCMLLLPRAGRRLLETQDTAVLPQVVRKALAPTSTLAMVGGWWLGLHLLDFGANTQAWLWWTMNILTTIVAVFAAYRLLDLLGSYLNVVASRTQTRLDDVLIPLLQKTLKVLVIAIGGIIIAKVLGFQVTPLLAGLGLGGLAFGLAAQDTLKNFFGSVNVILDRPFQVGDWVKIGDTEGTVETLGLRSSRIRTFYNSQITVPNSELMNARIDNMGRRQYRRISTMLAVPYSTRPEQLEAFCEGIRELVRLHPHTRKDYFQVYVNRFAPSSIDILLYVFHETPDWTTELQERHRLLLDIIRLAERLGVDFAFPTQTIHLRQEGADHDGRPIPPDQPAPPDTARATETAGGAAAHASRGATAAHSGGAGIPGDPTAAADFGREQAAAVVGGQSGGTPTR